MNYTLLRNSNFANDARLNHTPTVCCLFTFNSCHVTRFVLFREVRILKFMLNQVEFNVVRDPDVGDVPLRPILIRYPLQRQATAVVNRTRLSSCRYSMSTALARRCYSTRCLLCVLKTPKS